MTTTKILVVDDEPNVCELIRIYLEREGYDVIIAHDGETALSLIEQERPQLVVLDLMLPKLDGWKVCEKLRSRGNKIPIIMLSAKGEEMDRILGLELGADDYVTKPFSPMELVARIKALFRRLGTQEEVLRFEHLTIDKTRREVLLTADGQQESVQLTPKEFELLWFLASNRGLAFSREQILDKVWGYDYFGDTRTVDAHIKRLRQKLQVTENSPQYIHTIWGVGYKFEEK
ncbi:MAG: response regulator transcription factor [Firmicutes bacterium]|jgi:DNA-binding response OmpR family regulator|nr:response regulator transcription factor [Bacillota bacterium]HOB22212.1 response regulator transcription factor [Bacillota bacterium]HQD40477.1 response regulator transcription factor [Bacillota bacterium]